MNIKKSLNSLIAIIIVLSILIVPVIASDTENTKEPVIKYEDIEKRVLEDNLQLKAGRISVNKLEDSLDDAEEDADEAKDDLIASLAGIESAMRQMQEIISTNGPDSDIGKIAYATYTYLNATYKSLENQIESLEDSTDGSSGQIKAAKLNLEQAEKALVNSAKNMFILYHQLGTNIKQLENSRDKLKEQLNTANKNFEQGLINKNSIIELETSLLELDASHRKLVHERDMVLLQVKNMIGLTYKDNLTLGDIPLADRELIDSIDFEKDLQDAVKNAMSIKIKDIELSNSSVYDYRRNYELQLKENEAVLNFMKQYHSLLEINDSLLVSESKLNAARYKLEQGKMKYSKGLISLSELKVLENEVKDRELEVESNLKSLLCEIENYKAKKDGVL